MNYPANHPVVITEGNNKIGRIPNVSLPPVTSCEKGVPCAKDGCYAMKYQWRPSVKDARHHNWRIWKKDPDKYFNDIREFLTKKKPSYFRFHVDGDIPNEQYFNMMIKLADDFPSTRFLAFTKRYKTPINKCPSNLTIIPSAWPGYDIPEFPRIAWMEDGREDRHNRAKFDCSKGCDQCYACWHIYDIGKDVVFHKH